MTMKPSMRRICHQPKIFYAVVANVLIDMVNHFALHEEAPKVFLHNEAMFLHISSPVSCGMFGGSHKNVPSARYCFSTFPRMVVWAKSFWGVLTDFYSRFFRVVLAFKCALSAFFVRPIAFIGAKLGFLPVRINIKFFTADLAKAFNFCGAFFVFTAFWASHNNLLDLGYYNSIFNGGQALWHS